MDTQKPGHCPQDGMARTMERKGLEHDCSEAGAEGLERDNDREHHQVVTLEEEGKDDEKTRRVTANIEIYRYRPDPVWELATNEILLALHLEGLLPYERELVTVTLRCHYCLPAYERVEVELIEE